MVQVVNPSLSLWLETKFSVLHVVGEVENNDPLRNAQNIRIGCQLSLLGAPPEAAPNSCLGAGDFFCCAVASLAPPATTKASATCKPRTLGIVQTIRLLAFNRMSG